MKDRSVWGIHDNQGFGTVIPSGCGYYRITLPLDELAKNGWAAGYSPNITADSGPPFDPSILIAQRFDQAMSLEFWKMLKDLGYRLVYEIDDNPFAIDTVNWLAAPLMAPQVLKTMRACAEMSHAVTVTTEPLAQVMREFNPNVTVIPNYIPEEMLGIDRARHDKLTMGFAGGASHLRDLAMIAQIWRDVIDETGSRGHFIGGDYRNMLRPHGFDYTGWEPYPSRYYRLIDFDIGIIPIADGIFNRSKSSIKALEYAALGIPSIASDCEAYRDFIIDGKTGFLVKTQAEWRDRMMMLCADDDLREQMGEAAREHAAEWTIERNWHRWQTCYENLLEE